MCMRIRINGAFYACMARASGGREAIWLSIRRRIGHPARGTRGVPSRLSVLGALVVSWLSCLIHKAIRGAFRRRSSGDRVAVWLFSWAVGLRSKVSVAVKNPPERSSVYPPRRSNCPHKWVRAARKAGSAGKRAAGGWGRRCVLCAGGEPARPMAKRKSVYACSMRMRTLTTICDIETEPVQR